MKNYIKFFKKCPLAFIAPLLGGIVWAILDITDMSFSLKGLANPNLWINSFMCAYSVFSIFTCIFDNFFFFRKHSWFRNLLSFLFSTIIGGVINFSFAGFSGRRTPITVIMSFILGFLAIFFAFTMSYYEGYKKANIRVQQELKKYFESYKKMDERTRNSFKLHIHTLVENSKIIDYIPQCKDSSFYNSLLNDCLEMDKIIELQNIKNKEASKLKP